MLKYIFLCSTFLPSILLIGQTINTDHLKQFLKEKKYSELISQGKKILEKPCGIEDSIITLHQLAVGYRKLRKLDSCWHLCSKSMQLAIKTNNELYQIKNHEELGILYGGYWNVFPRAIHHFEQVIYLAECFGYTASHSKSAYNNIATIYEGVYPPNYHKSVLALQMALQYVDSSSGKGRLLHLKIAHHKAQLGQLNASKTHLVFATTGINMDSTSWYFQKWYYKAKGHYHLRNKENQLSYLAFDAYRKIATEHDKSITGKTLAYEMLMEWSAVVNNTRKFNSSLDSARHYLWAQNKIGDTQFGARSLAKYEEEQVQMEFRKEKLVRQLTEVQTSKLEIQCQQRKAQNTNMAILLGLGFVGIFQFRTWRKSILNQTITKHKLKAQELEHILELNVSQAEVDAKNGHLQRIGQRMHDELSSTLTGLLYKMQEMEKLGKTTPKLNQVENLHAVVRHCSHILSAKKKGQLSTLLSTLATQYPFGIHLKVKGSSSALFYKEMDLFQHLFAFLDPENNPDKIIDIDLQIKGKKAFISLSSNHFESEKVSQFKDLVLELTHDFRFEEEPQQMLISFFLKPTSL
ncbi:MAG: hypothetical protein ACI9YL_001784 [Luteibaculaceae bacterium]|jgi:hypothetical protein